MAVHVVTLRITQEIKNGWFKYNLGQKKYTPQVRPDRGLNSRPSDHDSTLHVTETPALTTRLSVTSKEMHCHIILRGMR